jgi:phosphohistidine phosphatase
MRKTMKSLFLLRHAKSSWSKEGLPDIDRPLNDRGRKDAPKIGRILRDSGTMPERIVSSPAKRALKTARLVAKELGYPETEISVDPQIYAAAPDALLAVIRELDDAIDRAMLVGHNPGLSELANRLSTDSLGDFSTCTVVRLDFAVDSWRDIRPRSGVPGLFEYPKERTH